jgi:hypothetical protein
MRRWTTLAVAGALVLPLALASGQATGGSVEGATTGNNSELVLTVPVTGRSGSFRQVMRLAPALMPNLRDGDSLRVSAELAVTTDCTRAAPRCTGRPYSYDPQIDTQVVLTSPRGSAVLAKDRRRCIQQPGDRQHHCVIPFNGVEAGGQAERLGCDEGGCALEMLMSAHSANARSGQLLIIGGQDESGRLSQDKGRINAIRLRGSPDVEVGKTHLERDEVPPDLRKRVVLSQRLSRLRRGDVVEASLDLRASVDHLPYPALVGSQIVLAETPGAIHGKRFVSRVANLRGELTEGAGTNCTQAQTPCPVFRTGMLNIRESAITRGDDPVPLYLNVVIRANNKLKPEQAGDVIRLRDTGGLRTRIYRGS